MTRKQMHPSLHGCKLCSSPVVLACQASLTASLPKAEGKEPFVPSPQAPLPRLLTTAGTQIHASMQCLARPGMWPCWYIWAESPVDSG